MAKFKGFKSIILIAVLLASVLACGSGGRQKSTPTPVQPPAGPIQPNEEASKRVQQNFNQSLQESAGGYEFRFRATSEEVTSIVANALQQRADIPIANPQIWFADGQIHASGTVSGVGPKEFSAMIIAVPQVNDGQVEIEITQAKMGQFNLPDSVVGDITRTVNESLAELQLEIQLTDVEIRDGEIIITGRRIPK